jgi:hypothetical protein|nr:PLD nuclease N-terminal domain-containing protein [uncultured Nocardioides sp.]
MLRLYVVVWAVGAVLWLYCLVDAITSSEGDVRNLPKLGWIFLVLLFPFVGSVAWLVAGRPQRDRPRAYERPATGFPEYDRPGRFAATSNESDEEFLRRCRERAEEQRRRYRDQREQQEPDDA